MAHLHALHVAGANVHASHGAIGACAAHHCRGCALGQSGEDLVRVAEGEILEQHHDFLGVCAHVLRRPRDERRRHEKLLLQPLMGVHPMRARSGHEVVAPTGARND
jgi:hypothetical protein